MSETRLPLDEALAVATSCGELLRSAGRITVALSSTRLPAHSWLTISISYDWFNDVSLVRVAIDVLRALTQCPGYAPMTHPHVWEDLLFHAGVELEDARCQAFDDGFPRVQIQFTPFSIDDNDTQDEARWIEETLNEFTPVQSERRAEYEALMARLSPYRDHTVVISPLQLFLSLPSMDTQWLLPVVASFTEHHSDDTLEIVEISVNQLRYQHEDPLHGLEWLRQLKHVPTITQWTLDQEIYDPYVYIPLYRELLGLDGTSSVQTIRTLEVGLPNVDGEQLRALCSALPFTQRIHRVRIRTSIVWEKAILWTTDSWSWPSYAMFHPHTTSSTWRELEIRDCAFNDDAIEAVVRVQEGGIYDMIQIGRHKHTNLSTQCVMDRASVWHRDDLDTMSKPLLVLAKATFLDAIGEPFREYQGETLFQTFVVPGVGVAYVRVEDIIHTASRRDFGSSTFFSGTRHSSLTTITVDQGDATTFSMTGFLSLLRACGSSITSLNLVTNDAINASDVEELLLACPRLGSFGLDHDGSYWRTWESNRTDIHPHLTSIRQTCSYLEAFETVKALSTIAHSTFPVVTTLFFHVTKGNAMYASTAKALGAILLANPTIEAFAMVKVRPSPLYIRRTPSKQRALRLQRLGLPSSYLEGQSPIDKIQDQCLRRILQLRWIALDRTIPTEVLDNVFDFIGRHKRTVLMSFRER